MKKRIIALLLCMTTAFSFSACGNKGDGEETTQENAQKAQATYKGPASADIDIDLEKQVKKLPDYKKIKVTITGNYDVTDEQVESSILSLLPYYGITGVEIKDRDTVEEGDYVMIDYTGYKDDVAFENGTAENIMMDVSNNMDVTNQNPYIDGFCDDLVGAKIGDELDTHVTFPENYDESDLAGQPVVFKITVKGIYEPVTMDNLTDEMVKSSCTDQNLESRDDLKKYVRDALENQAANSKSQASLNEVQKYMLSESEVEIPDEYFQARLAEYQASFEKSTLGDTQTMDDYLKANNTTLESLQESWKENLEDSIKLEFIFGRIADLENIKIDETDFDEFIQYIVDTGNGEMTSADEVYEYYGNGSQKNGEKMLRQMYRVNTALSQVVEDADVAIQEKAQADTETQE